MVSLVKIESPDWVVELFSLGRHRKRLQGETKQVIKRLRSLTINFDELPLEILSLKEKAIEMLDRDLD